LIYIHDRTRVEKPAAATKSIAKPTQTTVKSTVNAAVKTVAQKDQHPGDDIKQRPTLRQHAAAVEKPFPGQARQ
jgi:hypothetical protein